MNKQSSLSVVMIVKNEADKLATCLQSIVDLADEIIILDSGSTDNTEAVAKQYGAKWLVNAHWQGFGKQRQIAQSYASGDYVLALDADEVLNVELQQSIAKILSLPLQKDQVFSIKRENYFFNYPIYQYSWHTSKVVRLYARAFYQYHDYEVHESLNTRQARVVTLKGKMKHITNQSVSHFLVKNLRYSNDWAREKRAKRACFSTVLLKSFFGFLRFYLVRGGAMGGGYGLIHSLATTYYTFNKYLILHEANRLSEKTNN